jgi:Ca-activated chloride channel family protein
MMGKAAVLATLCILSLSLPAVAQQRIIHVATEEVSVDVLVTVDRKPLDGLQPSDFEIYDNGVKQKIEYAQLQQSMPLDVILVFDISRSVIGERLDNLKNAAHELVKDFRNEDSVALVTFNHAVYLGSPLTEDMVRIQTALDRVQPSGESSLIDACFAGLMLAEYGTEHPLIIIFSDGVDTSSWLSRSDVLETAQSSDTVIYAISAQPHSKESFLTELTECTGGRFFEAEYTQDLAGIFLGILKEFRKRYLLSYIPQGVSKEGWHELDVRVHHHSAEIQVRPGYMIGTSKE